MTKTKDVIDIYKRYVQDCYPSAEPLALVEGNGTYVRDAEGREYLDFFSGIAVNNVGHCHPKVVAAAREQVGRLMHTSFLYNNIPMAMLAKKLVEISPKGLGKAFFAGGGAEAVEGAVKLAKKYASSNGMGGAFVISLESSFHGRTALALTLTGQSKYKQKLGNYANFPGVEHIPPPYCYRCPYHLTYPECDVWCADYLDQFIELNTTKEVAAMIVEPVMGEGGIIVPPKEYLPKIRDICKKRDTLLIVDEIQTGLGRTGKLWGCQHFGVEPDIITVGKALGGGLPLSAVVAKDEIAASWEKGDHAHTFSGNPVCCAAGLAALEVLNEQKLDQNAAKIGNYIMKRLNQLKGENEAVGDVRGLGLMIGIEMVEDKKRTPGHDTAEKIKELLRKKDVLVGVGGWHKNVVRVQPPLTITEEHADTFLDAFEECLRLV